MDNKDLNVLFKALSQILSNQDEIKKHIGLNKFDYDYGYSDTDTDKISDECYKIARQYEEDEQEIVYEFNRGLFQSEKGEYINADVNGSYQIIKKVFPKAFVVTDVVVGVGSHPVIVNIPLQTVNNI